MVAPPQRRRFAPSLAQPSAEDVGTIQTRGSDLQAKLQQAAKGLTGGGNRSGERAAVPTQLAA